MKHNLIIVGFSILGLWLVWELRLLGLFIYGIIIYGSRFFGLAPTKTIPKIREKNIIYSMYAYILITFILFFLAEAIGWLEPVAIKVAAEAYLPSLYDNSSLLVNGGGRELYLL